MRSESAPHPPPRTVPPRARSGRGFWLLSGAVLLGGILFYFFNPADHAFFPGCQFHQLSGLLCPGCGGQRALHHLLHGEIGLVLRHNALLFPLVSGGLWLLGRWLCRQPMSPQLPGWLQSYRWLWLLATLVIGFTVLRNIPGAVWLRP